MPALEDDLSDEPFVQLRFPKLENLRMDPFERAGHDEIGAGMTTGEGNPPRPAGSE